MQKTIVITGNHHTPAIELIRQLRNDKKYAWQIIYISHTFATETHLKNTVIPMVDQYINLSSSKLDRQQILKSIFNITPQLPRSVNDTIKILRKHQPSVVVSFGGYTSVPVIIASRILHIPSLTHEQTLTTSLATRINSLFANKVAFSFSEKVSGKNNKHIYTGNLLRNDIFNTSTANFNHLTKQIVTKPLIYITGGNQGSHLINQTVKSIIQNLNKYTIIHQTGQVEYNEFLKFKNKNYLPQEYISSQDIGWVLQKSSLVIGRSGSNFCQEIVALNKMSILIPLSQGRKGDQDQNALWVKKYIPQSITVEDKHLSPKVLLDSINTAMSTKIIYKKPETETNYLLLNLVHELSKNH